MTAIDAPSAAASSIGLKPRQFAISAAIGAVVWLVAALALGFLGPLGIYEGGARALVYAAIVPGTVPIVLLLVKAAGLAPGQAALGMAAGTGAATLLDGLALAWAPALYGGDVALVAGAGAAILWGAGVGLMLGFAYDLIRR